MKSEILPHLYIGDSTDAKEFKGHLICVLEGILDDEPPHAMWVPVFETHGAEVTHAKIPQLELVCLAIQRYLSLEEDVMIHCGAGMERSPLTVIYFLHKYRDMGLEEAWQYVKRHRPASLNRLQWLRESQP
ncbi:MAG TPA: hypothetical protein ENI23_11345 [bacterium]|nr:hypothetical protein [bacterium]